jgi:hypothetical protein
MTELGLREEYELRKLLEQEQAEKNIKELLEHSVLIVERLDTGTIERIVDAMNGVEDALSFVLPKLPSLKQGLDKAEAELTTLISSGAGSSSEKMNKMLVKALAFYQNVSSFLKTDLTVLLKSRLVASARKTPEFPVGPKMAPIFLQALKQEKTGGIFKRLFGTTDIPYIDNNAFANELTSLTIPELEKLSKVGQVPTVISQSQLNNVASQVAAKPEPGHTDASHSAGDLQAVITKLGGAQGVIEFLKKNNLDKADSSTTVKALQAVINSK